MCSSDLTYVFRTRSLQHLGMAGTEYTLACWCGMTHLVTLDALLAVLCAFAWAPFVAASRAPPRTSWAAKLGSLAFKNGLSSEVRNWPSLLVQNLDKVLGVLCCYIQSAPWAIF